MKRFYDKALIETCLKQTNYESIMNGLQEYLFVVKYEKNEFVTMPLQQERLFQIIIQGAVSIYFIRDDGSAYSLTTSRENELLGEMELFQHQTSNVYAEAKDEVICLALSIEASKYALLKNCRFLQLVCESLTKKWNLSQRLTLPRQA